MCNSNEDSLYALIIMRTRHLNKTQAVLTSRNQYRKHEVAVHSSEECSPGSVVTSLNSVANDC